MIEQLTSPHLSEWEQRRCDWTGGMVREESLRKGLNEAYGFVGDGEAIVIQGDRGEAAVAKALNIWHPVNIGSYTEPDLSHDIQVRSVNRKWKKLIVRDNAVDHHRYVLVIERGDRLFQVVGWIPAGDAKRDEWRQAPNGRPPAWFVPQKSLRPITELKRIVLMEELEELTLAEQASGL